MLPDGNAIVVEFFPASDRIYNTESLYANVLQWNTYFIATLKCKFKRSEVFRNHSSAK